MFNKEIKEIVKELDSDIELGLSDDKVISSQNKYGKNILNATKKTSTFVKFLLQFKDILIIILLVAALISIVVDMKEWVDSLIIFVVVIVNAVLGVIQENKAEKSLESLKKMSSPSCKVIRNGKKDLIKSEEVCVGDILFLEAGDIVPSDCRIIECHNLSVDESSLTGESVPVNKSSEVIKDSVPLAEQTNMLFSTCPITNGDALAIVTSVGMNTEIGKIATLLENSEAKTTPLQDKLAQVGKGIGFICIIICVIVFALEYVSLARENIFTEFYPEFALSAFKSAIALAVAAIPEGLATVVTIVLALGVEKMAKRNAIVKRLPAVETLGATQVICSDKTGTLTQNKMTVTKLFYDEEKDLKKLTEEEKKMLGYFALCCSASKEDGKRIGDPTELALLDASDLVGIDLSKYEVESTLPFDSDRKLMSVLVSNDKEHLIITKGAFDVVLNRSKLTTEEKKKYQDASSKMASTALRVLAISVKKVNAKHELTFEDEEKLDLLGMVGMIDPCREEVKESIKIAKRAGIRVIMITGDHSITASSIASELGIKGDNDKVITSSELSELSDEYLNEHIEDYSVYARVAPSDKVRIVKAWQNKGKIVAMTGDGVNDAPALKLAEIGCAMGITGTEVSKEASDMILTDDKFDTIVVAVKEGRGIYNNITKCVKYLLSSNIGEVFTIFVASIISLISIGFGLPLLPIHLLWINLITDSLPAFGLGVERADDSIMLNKPRNKDDNFFANGLGYHIAIEGIIIGILTLVSFVIGSKVFKSELVGQTMAFFTLSSLQLFHAYNVKSERSIFSKTTFNNKFLNIAFVVGMGLQFIIIYTPLNKIFKLDSLEVLPLLTSLGISLSIILIMEIYKLIKKGMKKDASHN